MSQKPKLVVKKVQVKVQPKTNSGANRPTKPPAKSSPNDTQPYQAKASTTSSGWSGSNHGTHKGGSSGSLGAPSGDWAAALANPRTAPLCGIPTEFPLAESMKTRCFFQGTATIGTGGVGFVQWAPLRGLANNFIAVYYSTSGFALATSPVTYAESGVMSGVFNGPFGGLSYGSTAALNQGRVVSCQGSVWYTGTELNLSGEMYALRHPDNAALTGGLSVASLASFPTCARVPVTTKRDEVSVIYLPVQQTDVDYQDSFVSAPLHSMIMFTGVAGTTYGFRIDLMFEVIGQTAVNTTRTHGDPEGFAAVLETAEDTNSVWVGSLARAKDALVAGARTELSNMSGLMAQGVSSLGRGAVRVAANALYNTLSHRVAQWRGQQPPAIKWKDMQEELRTKDGTEISDTDLMRKINERTLLIIRREPLMRVQGVDGTFDLVLMKRKHASDPLTWKMVTVDDAGQK